MYELPVLCDFYDSADRFFLDKLKDLYGDKEGIQGLLLQGEKYHH